MEVKHARRFSLVENDETDDSRLKTEVNARFLIGLRMLAKTDESRRAADIRVVTNGLPLGRRRRTGV